jgi:DNA-binding MarR family transcriptional regulator
MDTAGMDTEATDREIVDLLIAFMEAFKGHFVVALEKLDLPLSQGHLLMRLDEPLPMSSIAKRMGFDASHITALIDRLEERGLIERHTDPHDRRVKRINVTEVGAAVRDQIRSCVYEGLPPLARLTSAERIQLRDLLATATGLPSGWVPPGQRLLPCHEDENAASAGAATSAAGGATAAAGATQHLAAHS